MSVMPFISVPKSLDLVSRLKGEYFVLYLAVLILN